MVTHKPWLDQEAMRGRRQTLAENSTRLARSYYTHDTHGWGEFCAPGVTRFGCTFIEEPRVLCGWALDGDTLVDGRFPRVSAGVYRWQVDHRGYYLGGWVCFAVDTISPMRLNSPEKALVDPYYTITHHFVFEGLAIKDVPTWEAD